MNMKKAKKVIKKRPSKSSTPRKRGRVLVKDDIQKIREEELGGGLFNSNSGDTRALFVSLPAEDCNTLVVENIPDEKISLWARVAEKIKFLFGK
jgi:hypothetical protein